MHNNSIIFTMGPLLYYMVRRSATLRAFDVTTLFFYFFIIFSQLYTRALLEMLSARAYKKRLCAVRIPRTLVESISANSIFSCCCCCSQRARGTSSHTVTHTESDRNCQGDIPIYALVNSGTHQAGDDYYTWAILSNVRTCLSNWYKQHLIVVIFFFLWF